MSDVRELPYQHDPLPMLERLRPLGRAVLLHSADRAHPDARFDVLAAAPTAWLTSREGRTTAGDGRRSWNTPGPPLALLDRWLAATTPAELPHPELPFAGGVIGLAGYDFARQLEVWPARRLPPAPFPDLVAGLYPWAVVIDHMEQRTWLIGLAGTPLPDDQELVPGHDAKAQASPSCGAPRLLCDVDGERYREAFERVQAYISAGDCYQVNLAVRFSGDFHGDALALYRALVQRHPAPFAGFMETPEGAVLSFSPERFLKASGGILETCPIKGTRPRGRDPIEDARQADALRYSAKDRAENLMIVDLLRNDLGRSCIPGSIEVPSLFDLESFGSVHHLVSRVRGRLAPDVTPLEAFARAFPGGSITGAPKIRAMEIIEELEAHARGPYCGSLFMADGRGRMDASITIRSMLYHGGRLYCWGGGGLVADSHVADEWAEIHHKVGALIGLPQE